MTRVGYLLNTRTGLAGEPGLFYNYIIARDGIYVHGQNPLLKATVCIAACEVRGLASLQHSVELPHGRIPRHVYDLAISILAAHAWEERYLAVVWDRWYRLRVPQQFSDGASVSYERLPHTVMDIHSHSCMPAFFSGTDDNDETGLRLSLVVGELNTLAPQVSLRVGVYGYFVPLELDDVFRL